MLQSLDTLDIPRRRLSLERLDKRIVPAIATWNPQGGSTDWEVAANWTWGVGGPSPNDWPGHSAGRTTDEVIFDSVTSDIACYLNGDLVGQLARFKTDGYSKQITLGGNVNVGSTLLDLGLYHQSGTISISSGKTLQLLSADTGSHAWTGSGQIIGTGTLKVNNETLKVMDTASILYANMIVTGSDGILWLDDSMTSNLSLGGTSNGITVQSGGSIQFMKNVAAQHAFGRGGISGGISAEDHVITLVDSNTFMSFGSANVGGSILINAPVDVQGGEVRISKSNQEKPLLKFASEFTTGGYGLKLSGVSGVVQDNDTEIWVPEGVYINGTHANYKALVHSDADANLTGDLVFGSSGGSLILESKIAGVFGDFCVAGNVTFTSASKLLCDWDNTGNNKLYVEFTATLAGLLKMYGSTGPASGVWRTIINADTVSGTFGTVEWYNNSTGKVWSQQTQANGGLTDFQIKWEAIGGGGDD
jgi:hypothetical protein